MFKYELQPYYLYYMVVNYIDHYVRIDYFLYFLTINTILQRFHSFVFQTNFLIMIWDFKKNNKSYIPNIV